MTPPSSLQETAPAPPTPTTINNEPPRPSHDRQVTITPEIRARIVAALSTLKGKRGSPFSFVTSGESPSFNANGEDDKAIQEAPQHRSSPRSQPTEPSLKLSSLLRPLRPAPRPQVGEDNEQPTSSVKMPSYISSMTIGQTITDPVEGGILTRSASMALFEHFMLEMNAKWEYILDPHFDNHDNVKRRSQLLFATVLFCSSKFASYINGSLLPTTDPFLQSRLCSMARNLAVRSFAEGDRSIETMQAFYLLACWKEPDDDTSYLHSGYAFRILHDLDLEQNDGDKRHAARCRRTWLALFRQDKQQSLFFMRRASLGSGDEEGSHFVADLYTWLKMPHALPLDFIACCNADLRRIQGKLRVMVQKASSTMLACILELMDSELGRWKSTWQHHLSGENRMNPHNDPTLNQGLFYPGIQHLNTLLGLWEHSVRLNVSSAILRQALMSSVTSSLRSNEQQPPSSLRLDLPSVVDLLSTDVAGLNGSVEGAFGTLRQLLLFPTHDLRRGPDSVVLLGPNAALFLCLLLCLPCNGILGPSFQKAAVGLIRDVARHVGQAVQSPQDTVVLHAAYLDSLVNLLEPPGPQSPPNVHEETATNMCLPQMDMNLDETTLQAAHVLAGEMGGFNPNLSRSDNMFNFTNTEQNLQMQSLVNLLDMEFVWGMPPATADENAQPM